MFLVAAIAVALSTGTAMAANVLYHVDMICAGGTDYMLAALTARADTVTLATSPSDFDGKLAAGTFDVAIFFAQDASLVPDVAGVQRYLARGGKFIADHWSESLAPVQFVGFMGALWVSGSFNQTSASFTPAALNAGITAPLTLPGGTCWGTKSVGMRATGAGRSLGTWPSGDSDLIVGNGGRTFMVGFLSDTPNATDGSRFYQNLIGYVLAYAPDGSPEPIPAVGGLGIIALIGLLAAVGASLLVRGKLFS